MDLTDFASLNVIMKGRYQLKFDALPGPGSPLETPLDHVKLIHLPTWRPEMKPGPQDITWRPEMKPGPQDIAITLTLRALQKSVPSLALATHSAQRILILGVGSLGCALSRSLLSYGFTSLTLVDHGLVRPSNPHRQCLYTTADIGKSKVSTAAAALSSISSSMHISPVHLSIPTPGKGCPTDEDLATLTTLIKASTTVFLCTDTRESRFIPTILCSFYNIPAISIALAIDHLVVVRHGITLAGEEGLVESHCPIPKEGGCFFCVDALAPTPSYDPSHPTLDTCASTKPPLAPIAANIAVELLVNILSHPLSFATPPMVVGVNKLGVAETVGPCYGLLRHNLTSHTTLLGLNTASVSCKACGAAVQKELEEGGVEWLLKLACAPPPTPHLPPIFDERGGGGGGGGGGASALASEIDNLGWLHL